MNRGFTLPEILAVMAIGALLSGIVLATFVSTNRTQALDRDRELIVETLEQAHDQTLSSKNATQYGVHMASSTITFFSGASYNASSTNNVVYSLANSDIISGTTLSGGATDIIFERLTGDASVSGTLTLSSPAAGTSRTITIYGTGLVDSN